MPPPFFRCKKIKENVFAFSGIAYAINTGARLTARRGCAIFGDFNPRAHAGRDQAEEAKNWPEYQFQSTRPRGARLFPRSFTGTIPMFQSTRPRGARPVVLVDQVRCGFVSIHAPTRGATNRARVARSDRKVSIHAPTRGATHNIPSIFRRFIVSIHAPTRGATPSVCIWCIPLLFQSTRPRGARQKTIQTAILKYLFQSTRPRGARQRDGHRPNLSQKFQSTRPRGARQPVTGKNAKDLRVSIHAPTRGATVEAHFRAVPESCFNPRAHAGRDCY